MLQGLPKQVQILFKMGSESHLRRGGPQKASGEPLGTLLEASGAEKKKLGTALDQLGRLLLKGGCRFSFPARAAV